jgi:hypothetical protein
MTKSKVYIHLITVIKGKFGLGNKKPSYHHIFLSYVHFQNDTDNDIYFIKFTSVHEPFIHSFTHSFCSLSSDRSIASSKASSAHSAIQSFLFCTATSRFLKVTQ